MNLNGLCENPDYLLKIKFIQQIRLIKLLPEYLSQNLQQVVTEKCYGSRLICVPRIFIKLALIFD